MSFKASDMVNLMKRCADETIGNERSAWVYYGTVIDSSPLRILIDDHEAPYDASFFIPLHRNAIYNIGARTLMLAVNNHQKFIILNSFTE